MWNLTAFQYLALLGRAMRTPGVAPQQLWSKQAQIGSLQAPPGKHHFCCRYNEILHFTPPWGNCADATIEKSAVIFYCFFITGIHESMG